MAISLENQFPQQGNNFILIGIKFKSRASVLKSSPHSRASSLYSVLYTHQYNFKGRIFKILVGQMSSKVFPTVGQVLPYCFNIIFNIFYLRVFFIFCSMLLHTHNIT
jgi:hypothetical protein